MRAVIQLVSRASVTVDKKVISKIGTGLLVLLGVGKEDNEKDTTYLAEKISGLRIFPDQNKLMNKSILETDGEVLVVSQFTLYGDCRKGRRPSYSKAAPPERANELYEKFISNMRATGLTVRAGKFQAMMQVDLSNDGPVTILIDSKRDF